MLNVTNTSYNLLDLEPYYNNAISPSLPSSPVKKSMKNKRSPTVKTWRSPSPERKKKSPSPTKKKPNYDKFKDFRNLTEERDRKLRSLSPTKGKPYLQKSPEKRQKSPSKKKSDPLPALKNGKSKTPWNNQNGSLSTSLSSKKSLSNSFNNSKPSPYVRSRDPSPMKRNKVNNKSGESLKTKKERRRNNSLPELEVPKDKLFKKPKSNSGRDERRLSDVSTIGNPIKLTFFKKSIFTESFKGLEEKPVFRPIRNQQKKPKSSDSSERLGSPYRPKPKSLKKLTSPPQSTSGANKKGPMSRGTSHGSIGSELGFTNIATVKSATNSVQSTRSNFEINAKYVNLDYSQTISNYITLGLTALTTRNKV